MKKTIIWISFVSIIFPQSFQLNGTVTDATSGETIPNVNVTSPHHGTSTNENGAFSLDVNIGETLTFSHIGFEDVQISISHHEPLTILLNPTTLKGNEIVVYAGLLPESLEKVTSSVTVFNAQDIKQMNGLHFQDAIDKVPGLTWAGGTSRPRFFQIRGLGERSQYAGEGAPNYSIGFMMDDVDLSGIGMAGLLFDMDQIEIFKGPQSSIYGPNAMGGLIHMRSVNPFDFQVNRVSLSLGSDQNVNGGIGFGATLTPKIAYRVSYMAGNGNGFRENVYQNSNSTNQRHENMVRLKLGVKPTEKMDALFTIFKANLDNGYDAWAPDNNEALTTYTDANGSDSVGTMGYSLRINSDLPLKNSSVTGIFSKSQNDLLHSYDGDWGNDQYWLEHHGFDPNVEGWRYSFFDRINRTRNTQSKDMRFNYHSNDSQLSFVVGYYSKNLDESDDASGYIFGGDATALNSTYHIENTSIYSQLNYQITPKVELKLNGRSERQKTAYLGESLNEWVSSEVTDISFSYDHDFIGGKVSLSYKPSQQWQIWSSLAKGYKAGGINQHPSLSDENRGYNPEFIQNIDIGFRKQTLTQSMDLTFFYGKLDQKHVSISSQQIEGDPNSFVYYTANASSGYTRGLEWEQKVKLSPKFSGNVSIIYLDTFVDEFEFETAEGELSVSGGRALAHTPKMQWSFGLLHHFTSAITFGFNYKYTSEFYFSDSHNQMSKAYGLINSQISYKKDRWSLTGWIKNATDTRYATRGFYFGLEPPNYEDTLYLSYGDPKQIGITLSTEF